MDKHPLEVEYFGWLTSQVAIGNGKTYDDLFSRMHELEFVWHIPNDDNRVADGRELRAEFLDGRRYRFQPMVSILEVLIALSRRLAWNAGGEAPAWAWQLIENLRLKRANDPWAASTVKRVDRIFEDLIWRTYQTDGQGGFFPLLEPKEDQTRVEIWYQMHAYILEIEDL
jgi:hypothetical protein